MDPRELLPLPVSEGPAEEALTPSPVVCPADSSSTCSRWALFTNVMEKRSEKPRERANLLAIRRLIAT